MRILLITILVNISLLAFAQNDITKGKMEEMNPTVDSTFVSDSFDAIHAPLHLPTLTDHGIMPPMHYTPYLWSGFPSWDLHEGMNAQLGLSAFSTFGSGKTYAGVGFAENVSMMYAKALNPKLSIAVGGYIDNMTWNHMNYRTAGLSAVVGYQFDEHWSGYVYGQKSLVQSGYMPYPLRYMGEIGDKIGAAVRYTFSPSFSIQVNIERGEGYSPFYY